MTLPLLRLTVDITLRYCSGEVTGEVGGGGDAPNYGHASEGG